jgi:hypothetical protein
VEKRETTVPVFIRHSGEDENQFLRFKRELEQNNIAVWSPEAMHVGVSLGDQLRRAIEQCELCVFIATKKSLSSQWCMAELGAFWGAGKKVIIYLADPNVTEQELPRQFHGNLWTDDPFRVIRDSVQAESAALPEVLTPDLVLLLRYLERDDTWVLPIVYGKALAVANGASEEVGAEELKGWKRAVNYGLLCLAEHGLVERRVDTAVTYNISQKGKDVLKSRKAQERFAWSFGRELLPLSGRDP